MNEAASLNVDPQAKLERACELTGTKSASGEKLKFRKLKAEMKLGEKRKLGKLKTEREKEAKT
jgi:hypothetical protein